MSSDKEQLHQVYGEIKTTPKGFSYPGPFPSYEVAKAACSTSAPYQDSDLLALDYINTNTVKKKLQQSTLMSQLEINPTLFLTQFFGQKKITVIDIGGSYGNHYLVARKLLPPSIKLSWRIVETPALVKAAHHLATNELTFHTDIYEAAHRGGIDTILASGALQFIPDPYAFLKNIISIQASCISIHRTPLFMDEQDAIHIQQYPLNYNGLLPAGFTNRLVQIPETTMSRIKLRSILAKEYEPFTFWDISYDMCLPDIRITFSACYRRIGASDTHPIFKATTSHKTT